MQCRLRSCVELAWSGQTRTPTTTALSREFPDHFSGRGPGFRVQESGDGEAADWLFEWRERLLRLRDWSGNSGDVCRHTGVSWSSLRRGARRFGGACGGKVPSANESDEGTGQARRRLLPLHDRPNPAGSGVPCGPVVRAQCLCGGPQRPLLITGPSPQFGSRDVRGNHRPPSIRPITLSRTPLGVHRSIGAGDQGWSLRSTPGYLLKPLRGTLGATADSTPQRGWRHQATQRTKRFDTLSHRV